MKPEKEAKGISMMFFAIFVVVIFLIGLTVYQYSYPIFNTEVEDHLRSGQIANNTL